MLMLIFSNSLLYFNIHSGCTNQKFIMSSILQTAGATIATTTAAAATTYYHYSYNNVYICTTQLI